MPHTIVRTEESGDEDDDSPFPSPAPASAAANPIASELRQLARIAWPIVVTYLCSFGTPLLTLIFLARSSATWLGGSALGLMTCNVTGFSLIIGLLSGMDTLCAQAYGAANYSRVGIVLCRGLIVVLGACVPIALLWTIGIEPLLLLAGQPEDIARLAATYARIYALSLPAYAAYESLKRFLSAQVRHFYFSLNLVTEYFTNLMHVLIN